MNKKPTHKNKLDKKHIKIEPQENYFDFEELLSEGY